MEWQCPQGLRTSRHLRAATQIPVQPKGPSCTAPVSRARQGFTGLILNTYKSWEGGHGGVEELETCLRGIILKEHRRAKRSLVTLVLNCMRVRKEEGREEARLQRQLEPQDCKLAGLDDMSAWNMESSSG